MALAVISHSAVATPFAHEARSLGMGNIGVATADIATAPFVNPAMLSFQRADDDFSMLVAAGGFFNDNDGAIDDIEEFKDSWAIYNTTADPAEILAALDNMQALAVKLSDKVIAPELSAATAIGFSGETYSMAVSARLDVIAAGGLSNVSTTTAEVVNPAFNILNVAGAKSTEVGLSISRSFEVMNKKLSVGITPKIVSVEAVEFKESIITTSTNLNNFLDNSVQDLGDFTTIDLGIVLGLSDDVVVGLTAKNLITEELSFLTTSGGVATLSFDTQLKAGIAYTGDLLTLGMDLDLVENKPVLSGNSFNGLKRQNLSVGLEINAFDYVQLRAGMMKNIADGISDKAKRALTTFGVGLWLGFNVDVAVIFGEGDSMGAFAQAGFKF